MPHIEVVRTPAGAHLSVLGPGDTGSTSAVPLIVSLHYGGPVSPGYGRGLLEQVVAPALSDLDAVMVAPDCACDAWSDGPCVSAIEDAIGYAKTNFSIDEKRIVLVGYSKGALGTWALADSVVASFSAAIVMAGKPPESLDPAAWQVPLYVIQAELDELFPVALTVDAINAMQRAGVDVTLKVLEGVTHFETHRFAEPLRQAAPWLRRIWAG